jgi:lysophospholipase L1-like esterase
VYATLDLARLKGKRLRAWWYDPRTGIGTLIGSIEGGAKREFHVPPYGPDWVLVLDDESANHPPPGLSRREETANAASAKKSVDVDDPRIVLLGQIDTGNPKHPRLGYPGTGLLLRFQGSSLELQLTSDSATSALTVVIDHGAPALQMLRQGDQGLVLASGLDAGPHIVEVYKRTETWQGILTLHGIGIPADGALLAPPQMPARKLLLIGDSVTCGAGADNNPTCTDVPSQPASDAYHSFGMQLGRRLDAQTHLVCYGGRGLDRDYRGLGIADNVLNAPQFLDLSISADDTANRSPWDYRRWTPDGIVISLGTNDFNLQKTRPLDEETFVADYLRFLKNVRSEYPNAAILVTDGAIVTDPLLRRFLQEAAARTGDSRVFWAQAEHYSGNGCNAHPTAAQHVQMADDLAPMLRRVLSW